MGRYRFKLETVKVKDIVPNSDNPRGANVRENDEQLQYLKRSIKEMGLMVPLVVQKMGNGKQYMLLDGERRYYAVKELGIEEVPAHVLESQASKDVCKNLMFHIHTTRQQWDACQQCRALEPIYEELKKKFGGKEASIARQLVIDTGTNQRTTNTRLDFLRWPTKVKEMVYKERPELFTTVVEIEAQIITPAQKAFPEYFGVVNVNDVRQTLFNKYLKGVIHQATQARNVSKMLALAYGDQDKQAHALRLFKKIVADTGYTFQNAHDDFVAKYPEEDEELNSSLQKITLNLSRAVNSLEEVKAQGVSTFNKKNKEKLRKVIDELQKACMNLLPNLADKE